MPNKVISNKKWIRYLYPSLTILIILGLAAAAWTAYMAAIWTWLTPPGVSFERAGQFGDAFGALNGFLTACAFAAVIITYLLQREQLSLAKSQIAGQRSEIEAQERQRAETLRLSRQQAFEQTLFKMIDNWRSHALSVNFQQTGVQVRNLIISSLGTGDARIYKNLIAPPEIRLQIGSDYIDHVYRGYEHALGPYFRTLYQIFKLIELESDSIISQQEKIRYAHVVRSSLDLNELYVVAANCCSMELSVPFDQLAVKYGLLKHLSEGPFRIIMERVFVDRMFGSGQQLDFGQQVERQDA